MSSIPRFYVPSENVQDDIVTFSVEQSHQILHVLRLEEGDPVTVFTGTGAEYHTEIVPVSKKNCKATILLTTYPQTELTTPLHLWHGVLKPKGEAVLIQKATELGVTDIHPLSSARTVVKDFNAEHYNKIAVEACEVVGRVKLPTLHTELSWTKFCGQKNEKNTGIWLVAWEGSDDVIFRMKEVLQTLPSDSPDAIHCIIGPEGGFSAEEIAMLPEQVLQVSLGKRVVRAETAGILFLSNILYTFNLM